MLLARCGDAGLGQGAAIKRDPCGLRPTHLVENFDLHTLHLDILALPALHSVQMQLYSAGNLSKELVVHPHHSMALLMGLFFPAKMSPKCGDRYSSSVSGSCCSSLPLGTSSPSVRCSASVPASSVVSRGGLGAADALVDIISGAP